MNKYVSLAAKILILGYFVFVAARIGLYKNALMKRESDPTPRRQRVNSTGK